MTGEVRDQDVSHAERRAGAPRRLDYAADGYGWAMQQAAFIREGRFDLVDLANVAEEIESVGESEASRLESAIEIVLVHMLKWDHQPNRRSRSWSLSIAEHRERAAELLRTNPSLRPRLDALVAAAYRVGALAAARQMNVPRKSLPTDCPYSWQEITSRPFEWDIER